MRAPLAVCAFLLAGGCGSERDAPPRDDEIAEARAEAIVEMPVEDPFPDASEVRLFVGVAYPEGGGEAILSNPAGVPLTAKQRMQFESSLVLASPPDDVVACFIPHHFFRYYDAGGEEVGEIEVCFCCEGMEATGGGAILAEPNLILSGDYSAIKEVVAELGEPTNVLCD